MRQVQTYVETDVNMAEDHATAAWVFDVETWGRCGQGQDEESALTALSAELEHRCKLVVTERLNGDEQAFERDMEPASNAERAATLEILTAARRDTLALVATSPSEVLDFDDPTRVLPAWARWRTLRQMAWHLADTESRYYLPSLGLPDRPAEPDLITELDASGRHVQAVVTEAPANLIHRSRGETWTTTKLLRRLAWHERSELVTLHRLARTARERLGV